MKNKIIILCLVFIAFLFSSVSFAGIIEKSEVGLGFGPAISMATSEDTTQDKNTSGNFNIPNFGLVFYIPIDEGEMLNNSKTEIGLDVRLWYLQRGFEDSDSTDKGNVKADYIHIPIMGKFLYDVSGNKSIRLGGLLGLQFNFNTSSRLVYENSNQSSLNGDYAYDNTKGFLLGLMLGGVAEMEVGNGNLFFNILWDINFGAMTDQSGALSSTTVPYESYNVGVNTIYFSAGYRMKIDDIMKLAK